MMRAACATDGSPEAWTTTTLQRGKNSWTDSENMRARAICATCRVRVECLEYAMAEETDGDEIDAIFGALSPIERRRVRKRKKLGKYGRARV